MVMVTGSESPVIALLARLVRDERAQDLIEYGLLAALVGIAGLVALSTLTTTMETAYARSNAEVQEAWEPCPPLPDSCS